MKKRIIILDHEGGGRLANQLWNFVSLYAYSLEKGYALENYSFFRYQKFFNIPLPRNSLIRFFFFSFLYEQHWYRMLGLYEKFVSFIHLVFKNKILMEDRVNSFYLPPSSPANTEQEKLIKWVDDSPLKSIYTSGWLFRNPIGIQKYHKEILEYFKPKSATALKIERFISPLREKYKHLIGVHVRQGDYQTWENGKYFFNQTEVRGILDDYLKFYQKDKSEAIFIICSDGAINREIFAGLNIISPNGAPIEDMFILRETDVIIGSNSTFSAFASYLGDVPFIVFERGGIDWEYYRGKEKYFENAKNTLTHY